MKGDQVSCEKAPDVWILICADANIIREPIEMFQPFLEAGERRLIFQEGDQLFVAETKDYTMLGLITIKQKS
jgi:hypothetical protein